MIFETVEKRYCESIVGDMPPALIIGRHLLMLAAEWYDLQPGARVNFYTVEISGAPQR